MASQQRAIAELMLRISSAHERSRVETPGWTIRRPLMEEVSERVEFVVAESKAATDEPLILPADIEATLLVEEGVVRLGNGHELRAPTVWTVHPSESRLITSLSYPTRMFGMFYRVRRDAG